MKIKILITAIFVLAIALSVRAENSIDIDGWKPVGKPALYNPQNVWDAINGAAEIYMDFGFRELYIQRYKKSGREIELEVYDQGQGINAFGIFRRERPPAAQSFPIGGEAAILEPYTCMMYQGSYLVRVKATSGDLLEPACKEILKSLAGNLKGAKGSPEILSVLPTDNRISGSVGYAPINYMGITDLKNVLHAKYDGCGEETCELFTIAEQDSKKVDGIWQELSAKWKHTAGRDFCFLHREIPYKGPVVVVKKGNRIWGASGKGDSAVIREWLKKSIQLED